MEIEPNRKFYRWKFESKSIPLIYQTKGVPIKIYRRFLFIDFFWAKAVAKDISIGGVGFVVSRRSGRNLARKFVIRWPNGERIVCTEKHHFDIGSKLIFYGVAWSEHEASRILPLLKLYSRKAFRGDTITSNVTKFVKK
ncbi:hypothetical protein [Moritella yayanosii]|uniref:PilZ domain-containing protein n=1 Tax=Moritella yayanosii TaxID=69539 RepID=A0A330LNR3_9GAMM|nr:hypothetical protein [Moritella yayanosii]SQD78634.1 conserved protein of unknown function [Moritella yayanosii]